MAPRHYFSPEIASALAVFTAAVRVPCSQCNSRHWKCSLAITVNTRLGKILGMERYLFKQRTSALQFEEL